MALEPSELVLNKDLSVYHLNVKGEDLADDIIVVGDQNRVGLVSSFFDEILVQKSNREFVTHTGMYRGKKISVVSTGIGPDNIDIVINELDAAVNIDPETKKLNAQQRQLNIIRIGTCGGLQKEAEIETFVASAYAIGLDGVLNYYDKEFTQEELALNMAFNNHIQGIENINKTYSNQASESLLEKIAFDMRKGVTLTANGFYGPQGRVLRLPTKIKNFNDQILNFSFKEVTIDNYEMETSALYGLSNMLNHKCLTVCLVVANRVAKNFSKDYKPHMKRLVKTVLDRI